MTLKLEVSIFSIVSVVAAVSATLMITAATLGLTDLVVAQGPAKFGFNLTGSEEVPPVQTNATGMADISAYTIAGDSITYSVNATNIKDVTAGHIHFGKQGENGPIVFTMFKYDPPRNEVLESGTITADKLEGPMKGKKVSDLAFAGANGSLYMNIHTVENPNGEIRGTSSIPPQYSTESQLYAVIATRLMSRAGRLERLARLAILSSSTIQVLGAEKVLFRSKTGARPPIQFRIEIWLASYLFNGFASIGGAFPGVYRSLT